MSNKGEPWKKFVQTFFLAEQPNGYFVLNDIFRFLKEETVEDEPSDEVESSVPDTAAIQEPPPVPISPVSAPPPLVIEPAPVSEPVSEPTLLPAPAPEPEEPAALAVLEPDAEQQSNGETPQETESAISEPSVPSSTQEEVSATPSPIPAASPAPPAVETPAPSPAPPQIAPPATPAPAAPTPAAPPVRKTWANLAAAGSNQWGNAVAKEAKGVSEVVVTSSPVPSMPHSPAPRSQNQPHPAYVNATTVNTPQCFVKVRFFFIRPFDIANSLFYRAL
jgi:hypothetical protein